MDCLFCKIVKKELPSMTVYEDENVYAFLDIHPINLGHILVVPKRHSTSLYDIAPYDFSKISLVAQKIGAATKAALKTDGINIMMNNDSAAGQIIFHAHLHVIPRFKEDGFSHWRGLPHTLDEIKAAGEKIKSSL